MRHTTDSEVEEQFLRYSETFKELFPLLKEHLQRKLKANVFISDEKKYLETKAKYEYLDEIHSLIKNSITRGTEQ